MSYFLLHMYSEQISLQLDDRWFHMPPGEPYEFEKGFDADKILEIWGSIYGIVQVDVTRSRTGTHIDIEAAEIKAKAYLRACEETLLTDWVRQQQENRVRHNFPPTAPAGRVLEIVENNKVDLKKRFGLHVTGMDNSVLDDPEKARLQEENDRLRAEVVRGSSTLELVMARLEALESAKTDPPAPPAPAKQSR